MFQKNAVKKRSDIGLNPPLAGEMRSMAWRTPPKRKETAARYRAAAFAFEEKTLTYGPRCTCAR